MALPRFTTALRAFSDLSYGESTHGDPEDELAIKRRRRTQRQAKEYLTWTQLGTEIKRYAKDVSQESVSKRLRDLLLVAKDIVGSETDTETLEDSAVLLFETFKEAETVTAKETTKLRRTFGPFPASVATKACSAVGKISVLIPEDELRNVGRKNKDIPEKQKMFGHNIQFFYPEPPRDEENEEEIWLLSDSDEEDDDQTFSMNFTQQASQSVSTLYDAKWLKQQVHEQFGSGNSLGMSEADICSTIFETLSSSRSDTELQNELFELLGFDRFGMIQELLDKRDLIISNTFERAAEMSASKTSKILKDPNKAPIYGCQVTIQSEEEKQLRKQFRREEKKMSRKRGDDQEEDEMAMSVIGLDPAYLRQQREASLVAAASAPLFSKPGRQVDVSETYPNVYDTFLKARQSSAFVGGAKLLLPDGFEKSSNKDYEEVDIPPSPAPPVNVGKERIRIKDLDEIAQMAFRNTKELNRIQSVVFDAAYSSNENLLICAPTGAGKTNIAMLTVVHEIQQHIAQGVIKKDEFKIVYVAPMKALAAEMVRNFGSRLEPLGISVRELTGDMSLTKSEIMKTQMLVTTPEKWDVVTRKSTGDVALTQIVRLLIIDEVHLLHDDRGSVIETLVARTLRQVESSQSMIRIVGLSATLPNYFDVARFLNVSPFTGLFYFDGRFRPVPLQMTFIGIKATQRLAQLTEMNDVCYDKVLSQVRKGEQVMVFVHARNETVRTAMTLCETGKARGQIKHFTPESSPRYGEALKQVGHSRNKQMKELFSEGFGIHHAGMLRQDRNLIERYFADGHIRVLVCTATLAWGVNLPAHAVIIKGTQIYDAKKGSFVDLGILDVMQIFGRAGRPQFDTFGHGTIITTHDKLSHYLSLLTRQNPIESQFIQSLADNLNAEVSLGTVTNVEEAVQWLSYTYLYVRMRANPLAYGIPHSAKTDDPNLENYRRELIVSAARGLDKARMVRFDERTGYLHSTDLGRTSSHFYIRYFTVEVINEYFRPEMTEDKILEMVSKSTEFEQVKVRDEELEELDLHMHDDCMVPVAGGSENSYGKVNILLQSYISRAYVENFSLVSDTAYVAQNSARILRALFEMGLRRGWPLMAARLLEVSKMVERRLWGFENPLRQFDILPQEVLSKLEARKLTLDKLKEMDAKEIGHMIHHVRIGPRVKQCALGLPVLGIEATIQPITRTVLRVKLSITPEFKWSDNIHGNAAETFWIWVEDPDNNHIYHSECFMLHKKMAHSREPQLLVFTIPIFEPLPSQYYVRAMSDRWLGSVTVCPISFQHLILPERHPPHTELLDLQPLPVTAFNDPKLESLYKFTHFNPIQTQIFHTLFHNDCNVLLGAPTGSGKTVAAEMAIFRVFKNYPNAKAVYIAPLKALVRERVDDWKIRIEQKLGKKVVELTGDVTPDMRAVANCDLIVTTPEKWDGVSRSWQTRSYVKAVSLLVIDEIHLLGDDRGPVLEVIVSRTNFMSSHTERSVRVVGLSTALANARDLADWLGIKQMGLFNFRPSVRPVPLEVHIAGFPGKHYCPRMATMNKPTFQAIRTHSPAKPVLVFVSSRRQTRLTALDLIAYLAAEDDPKQWLHMPELEMENIISGIRDNNLKLTLAFGIGLHHAGLHERDRKTSEELFVNQKIQVLIATSTLAWGVNFPAHLVVIKGTEYFDGKTRRYVDFSITDVLQMMGRAGRPQFDDQGKAVVLVHDIKKHFYKKFLYEPFPVESNLLEVLPDHLNAEIVAGTISSKQDAMDYITWTYFFRRLVMNPSFYNLEDTNHDSINRYLSGLVEKALLDLEASYCVEISQDNNGIQAEVLGRIASYYYLHHSTMKTFREDMMEDNSIPDLIQILSDTHEYSDLPVRHNEDQINSELSKQLPLEVNQLTFDSSNTKTHLLLQAHFSRATLPSSDYFTDTKSVMDQAIRILQAMLDVSADQGWLVTSLQVVHLLQMVVSGLWHHDNTLLQLPHVSHNLLDYFKVEDKFGNKRLLNTLPEVLEACQDKPNILYNMLGMEIDKGRIDQIQKVLNQLPRVEIRLSIKGWWEDGLNEEEERRIPLGRPGLTKQDSNWISIHADQEYVLKIDLHKLNSQKKNDSKAYSPRFPKPKDEGWILILGEVDTREVIALKRQSYIRDHSMAKLEFYSPEAVGRSIYTLYILSDSYIGLDQQYDICFEVLPPSIEAQVNSELKMELGGLDLVE